MSLDIPLREQRLIASDYIHLIANTSLVNVSQLTLLKATVLQTDKKTGAALVSDLAVCQREGIRSTPLTYHMLYGHCLRYYPVLLLLCPCDEMLLK